MQSIAPVTSEQLLAPGREPLLKLEIYVGAAWVNLCALDGKNYVESVSISLGGASMTPNPIGGIWSATLSNANSIFYPQHPTSAYKDYLKTGRKARISIGARYAGTDYYWQRMFGFMDVPRFEMPGYRVNISGADHMKFLQDTKLRELDNYWGTSETFDSLSSDGLVGSEIYNELDAMDINDEHNNVDNWTTTNCTFVSISDSGGGSSYVGKMVVTDTQPDPIAKNTNVGTAEAGVQYQVKFKYRAVSGIHEFEIWQTVDQQLKLCGVCHGLNSSSWTEKTFFFTALADGPIQIWLRDGTGIGNELRVDQISIFKFIPYWDRYYELPSASKGPYYVTLDGSPVWQGEEDEGWFHEESTRRVFFDINKTVANGTNNLVIYYFTAESPENAVADLLVKAGLYVDRAAALAAMEYTATGITIDRTWFDAGTTCLNAIKKLCERCDYRFYFKYDGTPVFKPKPAPGSTAFTFPDPKHIASVHTYQNRNEIRNKIVIKGEKQAEPVSKEGTVPSELQGEDHDQNSIDAYGERTLTINNHLFQDQTSIDNMCSSLLAEYKDPKWYADLELPFNPAPLELGDKISWKERLSPTLEITQTGVIRDIKINNFNTTYRNEK